MSYTPVSSLSDYLDRLAQLYIDSAVSDINYVARSVNDYYSTVRDTVCEFIRVEHGLSVDEWIDQIMDTWADNGYCQIREAITIWFEFGSMSNDVWIEDYEELWTVSGTNENNVWNHTSISA